MSSLSLLAVSCVVGFAVAIEEDRLVMARNKERVVVAKCPEHERLESEFLEARNRYRALTRLRRLTPLEEKRLMDQVAMAIARIKEHDAEHGCQGREKGVAVGSIR